MNAGKQILDALGNLPIEIDASPAPGQLQLFELAMRHGLPIATQDAQLKEAAIAAGVSVL